MPKALILTALSLERSPIEWRLEKTELVQGIYGHEYTKGIFEDNGYKWEVFVTETGMGNPEACSATALLYAELKPDVAIYSGIAGGRKECKINDVVISSHIYFYERGKFGETLEVRPESHRSSYELVTRANRESESNDWKARLIVDKSYNKSMYVKPIASGEKLISDSKSRISEIISSSFEDTLAVSMEDYGFHQALYRAKQVYRISVRGISDLLDKSDSTDLNQRSAADAAAACTFQLLSKFGPVVNQDFTFRNGGGDNDDKGPIFDTTISLEKLKRNLAKATKSLLNWPSSLKDGTRFNSEAFDQLKTKIGGTKDETIVILGKPGCGKSSLLSSVAEDLVNKEITVFAFKADQLPLEIDSLEKLEKHFDFRFPLVEGIKRLAMREKVVVLIDQLDALADLSDLKTGRLNAILQLIKSLNGLEGITLVTSSREFEYHHDTRLRALNADKLVMQPIDVESIKRYLEKRGYNLRLLTDDLLDLLRYPQRLMLFLELQKNNELDIKYNEHQLIEAWWEEIVKDKKTENLLEEVAAKISSREELWLHRSLVDINKEELDQLVSNNLLITNDNKTRLSFRHQSVFEFCRARSFIKSEGSLRDFVQSRENSLFIRPIIWMTLRYLRDIDLQVYERELGKLWMSQEPLRFHIISLIIEFVGGQQNPSKFEVSQILPMIRERNYIGLIMSSVAGSQGWFETLYQTGTLESIMAKAPNDAQAVVNVLKSALKFSKNEILDLIMRLWLPKQEYDFLSFAVIEILEQWSVENLLIPRTIIRRTNLHPASVDHLISGVIQNLPNQSPTLLLARLDYEYDQLPESLKDIEIELTGNSEYDEFSRISQLHLKDPRRKALIKLLEDENRFGINEIVESAPKSFIEFIFPWYSSKVSELLYNENPVVKQYRHDGVSKFTSRWHESFSLPLALEKAVILYAQNDSGDYKKFVKEYKNEQALYIHRLIAKGLSSDGDEFADFAAEYILEDERRLFLGSYSNELEDTENLLASTINYMNEVNQTSVINMILKITPYKRDVEIDDSREEIISRTRFKLLKSVKPILSGDALETYKTLSAIHEKENKEDNIIEVVDESVTASFEDDEWESFPNLPSTKQNFKSPLLIPSAEENLRSLAQRNPLEACERLLNLDPEKDSMLAVETLKGLGQSTLDSEKFLKIIEKLFDKGFKTDKFVLSVGYLIHEKVNKSVRVSKKLINHLEDLLENDICINSETVYDIDQFDDTDGSILFDRAHEYLPGGNFSILMALSSIYLNSSEISYSSWFDCLERHLSRNDSTEVWKGIARYYLAPVILVERDSAERFFSLLFQKYPKVLTSRSGALFLTRVMDQISSELIMGWLNVIKESDWAYGNQAYGELLTYYFIKNKPEEEKSLLKFFSLKEAISNQSLQVGIAYVVGNAWCNSVVRNNCSVLFFEILKTKNDVLIETLASRITIDMCLFNDDSTKLFLEYLANNPSIFKIKNMSLLTEQFEDIVEAFPHEIAAVTKAMLEEVSTSLADYRTEYALSSGHLVSIALTLHRLKPELKEVGLDLFEDCLKLGLPDATSALKTIDRTSNEKQVPRPRVRRLRKKRRLKDQ